MGGELEEILAKSHRPYSKVATGTDAKKIVSDIIAMVEADKKALGEFKITSK